ncbi:hypothetical protein HDU97_009573 [Phlyctochytrium planicorne]|nr:hypothetical protein HDU97_009573 [Phlyctochytrium planicorne]
MTDGEEGHIPQMLATIKPGTSGTSSFALASQSSSNSDLNIDPPPTHSSPASAPNRAPATQPSFFKLLASTLCCCCRRSNYTPSALAGRSRPPRAPVENVRVHIMRNDHGRTVVKTSVVLRPGTMGRRLFSQEDMDEYEYEDEVFDQADGRRGGGTGIVNKRGVPPPLLLKTAGLKGKPSQQAFLSNEESSASKLIDTATADSISITSIAQSVDDFEEEMDIIMKRFAEAVRGLPEPMPSRYQFKGLLGYGGNGFVADGIDNETGAEIAIKFIPKSRITGDSFVQSEFFNCKVPLEIEILRSLSHPNVVAFLFFYQCEHYFYIGMEKARKLTWRLGDDYIGPAPTDNVLPEMAAGESMAPQGATEATLPRHSADQYPTSTHIRTQSVGGLSILATSSSSSSILQSGSIHSLQRSYHTQIGSLHRHVLTAVSPSTPLPDSSVIPWQTSLSRRRQRSSMAQLAGAYPSSPSVTSPPMLDAPSPFSLISSEGLATVGSGTHSSAWESSRRNDSTRMRFGEIGASASHHSNDVAPVPTPAAANEVAAISPFSNIYAEDATTPTAADSKRILTAADTKRLSDQIPHPLDDINTETLRPKRPPTSSSRPESTEILKLQRPPTSNSNRNSKELKASDTIKRNSINLMRPRHSHPGDLYDFVTMYGITPLAVQKHIFRQLVSAYAAIRSLGFVYLDFRGENILIDDDLTVKLVDFGMAQREITLPSEELFLQYGTREASAPEVLRGEGYLGPEADIWALGLILFMIATGGDDAFKSEEEALRGIVPFPLDMDPECRDLIHRMLEVDRNHRAGLDETAVTNVCNQIPLNVKTTEQMSSDLEEAFTAFAAFGSARNLATGVVPSAGQWQMDSAKFAKMCRESGIICQTLSLTDVDIVFNQCKVGRKLDFAAFQRALELLAERRGCDVAHIEALVLATEPQLNGTIPEINPIVEKLTDTSKYTGTHRERFDETGVGRGAAGRDTVNSTANLSSIVSRHNPNKTLGAGSGSPRSPRIVKSVQQQAQTATPPKSPATPRSTASSVFDRLTSPNTFTGTHKHRFNPDGTGRGKEGRTGDGAGEIISNLSQITRK